MCTERKATGLFVLADFLCDNDHEYSKSVTGFICPQGITISQFDQYDINTFPIIMKRKIIQFE